MFEITSAKCSNSKKKRNYLNLHRIEVWYADIPDLSLFWVMPVVFNYVATAPEYIFGCWYQLQVPDEALSLVMSMGFRERDAKRALRISNQDVSTAVDFLVEQKAKRAQKQEEDIRRRDEIMWVPF